MTDKDKLIAEQAAEIARLRAEVADLKARLEQGVTLTLVSEGSGNGPNGPFVMIPVSRTVTVLYGSAPIIHPAGGGSCERGVYWRDLPNTVNADGSKPGEPNEAEGL